MALKHFLSHPFILRANGSGTRKEIDLFLERHQINLSDLNIVARMNDLESIKKSIVSGLGVSILSARSVKIWKGPTSFSPFHWRVLRRSVLFTSYTAKTGY